MDFDDFGWLGAALSAAARATWWLVRTFASVAVGYYLWGWMWDPVSSGGPLANQTRRARLGRYLSAGPRVAAWATVVMAPFALAWVALNALTVT